MEERCHTRRKPGWVRVWAKSFLLQATLLLHIRMRSWGWVGAAVGEGGAPHNYRTFSDHGRTLKIIWFRKSLAVRWLGVRASTAGGTGSIPGLGTKTLQAVGRGHALFLLTPRKVVTSS